MIEPTDRKAEAWRRVAAYVLVRCARTGEPVDLRVIRRQLEDGGVDAHEITEFLKLAVR